MAKLPHVFSQNGIRKHKETSKWLVKANKEAKIAREMVKLTVPALSKEVVCSGVATI